MPSSPDDPHWVFIPEEVAIVPPSGFIEHFKDKWWAYHPEKGLLFYRRRPRDPLGAQCNSSESVCKHLNSQLHPWAEVKFFPSVFVKINPLDYCP